MLPKGNLESWQKIHQFIDTFSAYGDQWLDWQNMVRTVVSNLENLGLGEFFRVGQGMHQIIFSTLDHHMLASEPRVTLEFSLNEQTVRIAYGNANLYFHESLSEEAVPIDFATQTTINYLRRLWIETKPETPIPDVLKAPRL